MLDTINRLALAFALALVASVERAPTAPADALAPRFDCNGNGIEDAIDIALGSSSDTNQNGVPDECEGLATRLDARRNAGSPFELACEAAWLHVVGGGPCDTGAVRAPAIAGTR